MVKSLHKRIFNRIVAVLVSIAMVLSMVTVRPNQAEAGLIVNVMSGKWSAIAMNAVERTVLWGIGKAQSATDNDTFATVLRMSKQVIGGKSGIVAGETLQIVKEMSAELDALYKYTVQSTTDIEGLIKTLTSNEAKEAFQSNAGTPLDTFTGDYNLMVSRFNALVKAYANYCDNPDSADAKAALTSAYNVIYDNYYDGQNWKNQVRDLFTDPLITGTKTTGFLPLISPYDPSQDLSAAAEDETSAWSWRNTASVDSTYLGYYYNYITTYTNLQNNVYDSMRNAATIVDNSAYTYLQAYRYYCEFEAMLLASDATLTEAELRTQTETLWNTFYDTARRVVRGLNQMYETQSTVFTTYMHTSDVDRVRKSILDYKDPVPFDVLFHEYEEAEWNNYSGVYYYEKDPAFKWETPTDDMHTSVIEESQLVYQFRLVSDPSKTYAIRSSYPTRSPNDEYIEYPSSLDFDRTSPAFYVDHLTMTSPSSDYYAFETITVPSTDLLTILKKLEGGYLVPANMSELSSLANAQVTSYDASQTLVTNIANELAFGIDSEDIWLPDITRTDLSSDSGKIKGGPNFMALRSEISWLEAWDVGQNPDAEMTLGNASMPYNASNQAKFDMEDDVRDHNDSMGDNEVVVMWTAEDPTATVDLYASDGGSATVAIGDTTLTNGQSDEFTSGTPMTISVTPSDGYTISSIQIRDMGGRLLEDIFSDATYTYNETDEQGNVISTESNTIPVQEVLASIAADSDGSYSFEMPVPYQSVRLQVEFAPLDSTLLKYDVTLNDVASTNTSSEADYDAVCQFGGYDYLGKKSFDAGEQVIVSVVGYNHHMANGLTITDTKGNAVDLAYEDVTDQLQRTRPTERLYSFDMPAQDLVVTPVLGKSGTVNIIKESAPHVTHTFENLGVYDMDDDSSWAHADAVDFVEGESVSISYSAAAGFYVSDIQIKDTESYSDVPATIEEGKIVFTMPATSVGVVFTEEPIDTSERMLTLDPDLEGASFQFVNDDGSTTSLTQRQFGIGETVQVKAQLSDEYVFEGMTLTANGSTENIFEAQGGTYDSESGMVTFAMPDKNATFSAQLLLKPQLTLASAEGVSLSFVDHDGNAQDGAQKRIASGEDVQVSVQVTDDTKLVQELVLTAGDSAENLFEAQGGTYDKESGMVTFAMPDSDATLSATLRDKTEDELYDLIVDEEGRVLIYTYENLVGYSNAIRKDPQRYSTADVVLMNNINATGKPAWAQGIGDSIDSYDLSFSGNIAFNGTFEGNGYCIFGMDWKGEDCTALFELVGTQGVIRNLNMYDCDSLRNGHNTSSFVVYNYGRIEHCTSGAGLANTISVNPETGEIVSLAELNSYLDGGGVGGGIACENYADGVIYACRSAAEVTSHAGLGGIVGSDSKGIVSNCASNAILTNESEDYASVGGITESDTRSTTTNSSDPGRVEGGYSSATINFNADDGYTGNVSSFHHATVVDTYYTTSEDQQPFGTTYEGECETINVNGLAREDMRTDSFVDALSGTDSNSVTWIRSDALNDGLPRIKNESDAFADRTIENAGVSASGNMHTNATLAVSQLPKGSEAWQLLAEGSGGGTATKAYVLSIQDGVGNEIPAELWVQSDLTYTVPVASADAGVVALLANGTVQKPSDLTVSQTGSGYEATFTGDVAVALMVLGGTDPEDDGFDTDDQGRIIIRTYEDLVAFSQAVRSNPKYYSTADAVLANNIDATGKAAWTQPIGSQQDKIAYNGTFEGDGHCIFGLDMDADYAGLFELVGDQGVVRNLFLYDCDCVSHAKGAGGVAVYNHGRIEYCVNGLNLTNGVYVRRDTGALVSLREYNSSLDANSCGGIAGDNYGTIYACRSSAEIKGSSAAGGIAGYNEGTVSNCAANNAVTSTASEYIDAGGLCGMNYSESSRIEAGYSSATIKSSVPYVGNIAGLNSGTVTGTYYTTSEDQKPYDDSSKGTATGVNGLKRGEMMRDSFVEALGAVEGNSVTWIRSDALNAGLPRIKNPSVTFADITFQSNGISITGNLHRDASMALSLLGSRSEAWKKLLSLAPDGYKASFAYTCGIEDAEGSQIPAELWAQSQLSYSVPVGSKNVAIGVLYADGTTKLLGSVKVTKNGLVAQAIDLFTAQSEDETRDLDLTGMADEDTGYKASFKADGAVAFMVMEEDTSDSGNGNNGGNNNGNNGSSNNGDNGGSGNTDNGGSKNNNSGSNSGSSSSKKSSSSTSGKSTSKTSLAKTGDENAAMLRTAALLAGAGVGVVSMGLYRRRRQHG